VAIMGSMISLLSDPNRLAIELETLQKGLSNSILHKLMQPTNVKPEATRFRSSQIDDPR